MKLSPTPETKQRSCSARSAFTLLELLMAIAVIGVLAALLLPALSKAKAYAHATTCRNNLRQMGVALKIYVEEHQSKYPYYMGPPGASYGDATFPGGRRGEGKGSVLWSSKLIPYYPMYWTNTAYHCPGYKGEISRQVHGGDGGVYRLGSYGYNVHGTGTRDYTRYYFGLGPVITWETPPVSEAQVIVPSEMLAIGDSQFLAGASSEPGGQDSLFFSSPHSFDPARHGKNYNQLWCDGHVAAMSPRVLFLSTNSAPLWNSDHQPHPESWTE